MPQQTWSGTTHHDGQDDGRNITMQFTGTTVYAYHDLAPQISGTDTVTNLSFTLDGAPVDPVFIWNACSIRPSVPVQRPSTRQRKPGEYGSSRTRPYILGRPSGGLGVGKEKERLREQKGSLVTARHGLVREIRSIRWR